MNCTACGTVYSGESNCPACGMPAERTCPVCGCAQATNHCPNCGADTSQVGPGLQAGAPPVNNGAAGMSGTAQQPYPNMPPQGVYGAPGYGQPPQYGQYQPPAPYPPPYGQPPYPAQPYPPYGQPQFYPGSQPVLPVSYRSRTVAMLLCLFLGALGVHRFYCGKIGSGVAWALTGGMFFVGAFVDLIVILSGGFQDAEGGYLKNW